MNLRKIICFVLVLTMLSGTSLVYANTDNRITINDEVVEIIKDNDDERISRSTKTNGEITEAILNKQTNIMTVKIYDTLDGKKVLRKTRNMDLNVLYAKSAKEVSLSKSMMLESNGKIHMDSRSSSLEQKTFSNYEYEWFRSEDKMELRRPDPDDFFRILWKVVDETSSNQDSMEEFRSAVEDVNDYEIEVITYTSAQSLLTIIGIILDCMGGGGSVSAILAGMGFSAPATIASVNLCDAMEEAEFWYHEVGF